MHSSFINTFSLLALATSAFAQTSGFDVFSKPEEQSTWSVGDTLPIVWAPGSSTGTVTLTLIGGTAANNLNPLLTIAAGVSSQSGAYSWPIPATVGSWASYGINLTSDADPKGTFQYSYAFHILNSNPSSSSSSSSSAASTSTAAPSSTSSSSVASTSVSATSTVPATSSGVTYISSTPAPTAAGNASTTTATGFFTATTSTAKASGNGTATATGLIVPTSVSGSGAGKVVAGGLALVGGVMFALVL